MSIYAAIWLTLILGLAALLLLYQLPADVPPLWSFRERLEYGLWTVEDKIGAIGKDELHWYKAYIRQHLDYAGDQSEFKYRLDHLCDKETKAQARERLMRWHTIPPPSDD